MFRDQFTILLLLSHADYMPSCWCKILVTTSTDLLWNDILY